MDTVWLTYHELADRLGIGHESARTLVKRKRWPRQKGNDGLARIGVPQEHIDARPAPPERSPDREPGRPPEPSPERPPEPSSEHNPDRSPDHDATAVSILSRHIERLEAQLDAAFRRAQERDQIAAQRDTLSVQVDALRAALEAAHQDRDRWHEAAVTRRSWWPWRRAS